ncbi:MAG: PDZ domain-containing protein [Pseudomonadota bacterium]
MSLPIAYSVACHRPSAHLLDVTLTIEAPNKDGQRLRMPAWIPGSYMIRDYARHVVRLSASCGNDALDVQRDDKSTWRIAPCDGPLQVRYQVYAWDESVRGAHVANTHMYFNGPCVFLEALDIAPAHIAVEIRRPDIPEAAAWQLATSMRPRAVDANGFGHYQADDYQDLIDHPVDCGALDDVAFVVRDIPHRFCIRGAREFSRERLRQDVTKIAEAHHDLLGTPVDLDRYVFLATATANGYGGLEHLYGSSLAITRSALPTDEAGPPEDAYRTLLGLISHEYFHLWNVKRMRPAVLTPYPLEAEVHTGLLWVFEGITSYYDDLAMVRAGVIDEASYLELLSKQITRVWRVPGRAVQSLADSSFDAWTKLYKRNENSPNATVSYYTKGSLVALALDLELRRAGNGLTLDHVMREAWKRYGETGTGMPERGLEALVGELADDDMSEFFERYVHGTEDPPLQELLATMGVDMNLRQQSGASDMGGKAADNDAAAPWLGVTAAKGADSISITGIVSFSPAESAGLSAGDQLIALDGLKLHAGSWDTLIKSYTIGDRARVSYFRGDVLAETDIVFGDAPADTCYLTPSADPLTARRRQRWLAAPAD